MTSGVPIVTSFRLDNGMSIAADPLNETPAMLRGVVRVAADPVVSALMVAGRDKVTAPVGEETSISFAVPVIETTAPSPLLLNRFQSVELKYPEVEVPAALILISGAAPPLDEIGLVAVTEVTVPTLTEPPRAVTDPLIVIAELTSLLFAIDPASIVLVTVEVSVV